MLFSSTDASLLRGFLLAACRHLSMVNGEGEYAQLAIQYKLSFIRDLRETIFTEDPLFAGMAITKSLVLAFDEVRPKSPPVNFSFLKSLGNV